MTLPNDIWNIQGKNYMNRKCLFYIVLFMGSMILSGCGVSAGASTGKIVFESSRDGSGEIYVMNPDGSAQTRLTNNTANDTRPIWSPDGKKILFVSDRDSNINALYAMNADGTEQARLSTGDEGIDLFDISPDGQKIAFMVYDFISVDLTSGTAAQTIYVMNADGSAQTRLVSGQTYLASPAFAWSPDGQAITYISINDEEVGISVINPDGSNETCLTNLNDLIFEWSPDGRRIAFTSHRDKNSEIYLMNADGSAQTRLTNSPEADDTPAWSPDGKKIAFISARDGQREVYVMNANGSNQKRLTNVSTEKYQPLWSPDGRNIVFSTKQNNTIQIYIMNANGSHLTILTDMATFNANPDWSP
jgi:Tol biopolymer transport system component